MHYKLDTGAKHESSLAVKLFWSFVTITALVILFGNDDLIVWVVERL